MTDRINSLVVVLDKDQRADDVEVLVSAIRQLKGVIDVTCNVSDISTHLAYARARNDIGKKIVDILYPEKE